MLSPVGTICSPTLIGALKSTVYCRVFAWVSQVAPATSCHHVALRAPAEASPLVPCLTCFSIGLSPSGVMDFNLCASCRVLAPTVCKTRALGYRQWKWAEREDKVDECDEARRPQSLLGSPGPPV